MSETSASQHFDVVSINIKGPPVGKKIFMIWGQIKHHNILSILYELSCMRALYEKGVYWK